MSNYYSGDGLRIGKLDAPAGSAPAYPIAQLGAYAFYESMGPLQRVLYLAGLVSIPVLGYHGFMRNDSVGMALVWGVFGSIVWPITVPVAFAQGYAKPRVKRNRKRPSRRTSTVTSRRRTSRRRRQTSRRP